MPPRGRPWQGFGQGPGEGQENAGQGRRPRAPSVVVRKAPKKAPALVVRKAEKAKKAPAPKKVPKKASKMIRSAPAAPKPRGRPKKVPPRAVLEPEVGEVEEDEVTEGAPAPAPAKRPAPAPSPAAPPAKRPTGASGGGALAGWRGAGEGGAMPRTHQHALGATRELFGAKSLFGNGVAWPHCLGKIPAFPGC